MITRLTPAETDHSIGRIPLAGSADRFGTAPSLVGRLFAFNLMKVSHCTGIRKFPYRSI